MKTPCALARYPAYAIAALAAACAHAPPMTRPSTSTDASTETSEAEREPPTTRACAWPRDDDDDDVVRWVLESPELCAGAFDAAFLAAVPVERLAEMRGPLTTSLGELREVVIEDGRGRATFERGSLPVRIARDDTGRVRGLFFGPPEDLSISVQEAAAQIAQLPGDVSVLVTRDGETVVDRGADTPLAVGSAFKLAVLAALDRAIDGGRGPWRAGWARVVRLDPAWRSLPSGQLQDWEPHTPMTVASLATLMISQSDNTATDALIALVGRDAVEAVAPSRVRPFLSTREVFLLKDPAHAERLARFRAGDEAARRVLLGELASEALPGVAELAWLEPSVDVEWHFTPREICALLDAVHSLPAMRPNPGLASRDAWREIAFKGGSEPGVLSLNTRLEDAEGHVYCVSAMWNGDTSVSLDRLVPLYTTTLASLQVQPAR